MKETAVELPVNCHVWQDRHVTWRPYTCLCFSELLLLDSSMRRCITEEKWKMRKRNSKMEFHLNAGGYEPLLLLLVVFHIDARPALLWKLLHYGEFQFGVYWRCIEKQLLNKNSCKWYLSWGWNSKIRCHCLYIALFIISLSVPLVFKQLMDINTILHNSSPGLCVDGVRRCFYNDNRSPYSHRTSSFRHFLPKEF